jgi:hypothetical protein
MKISNSVLQFLLLFLAMPMIGSGQIDCTEDPIALLRLDLQPAFQDWSIIQIKCAASQMVLTFQKIELNGKVVASGSYNIPVEQFKEFKATILPLEIQSMREQENLYMNDGMGTDITFIDRFGNFNRFATKLPIRRIRNVVLIEAIVGLTEQLAAEQWIKDYLQEIREFYLKYCR